MMNKTNLNISLYSFLGVDIQILLQGWDIHDPPKIMKPAYHTLSSAKTEDSGFWHIPHYPGPYSRNWVVGYLNKKEYSA